MQEQTAKMNRSNAVPSGLFQPQTLDVDENIFDKNLRIIDGHEESDPTLPMFRQLDSKPTLLPEPELPSVTVVPDSGMCVKTKNFEGKKFFINVCKIQAIPPAKPISEENLQSIIASEDYTSDYRIPMSLGAPRTEKDKSGIDCMVSDVAVNAVWYDETMKESLTFTTFFIHLAMEGLCEKYGDKLCNLDRQNWSILRNKRYMGKLQRHTIQQRASASKIEEVTPTLTQIDAGGEAKKSIVKEIPSVLLVKEPPEENLPPKRLTATIKLPKEVSKEGMSLEMGTDRLVLHSEVYSLDIFLPFDILPLSCQATFNTSCRQLKLRVDC